jgi:hypothetical protein
MLKERIANGSRARARIAGFETAAPDSKYDNLSKRVHNVFATSIEPDSRMQGSLQCAQPQ